MNPTFQKLVRKAQNNYLDQKDNNSKESKYCFQKDCEALPQTKSDIIAKANQGKKDPVGFSGIAMFRNLATRYYLKSSL